MIWDAITSILSSGRFNFAIRPGCSADGPPVHPETAPLGIKVDWEFPERGDLPPVKLTWTDGKRAQHEYDGHEFPKSGVYFVGDEGKLFANYGSYQLFPQEKFQDFAPPPQTIPASIGHHQEWIQACKTDGETTCNFDYSGALTETVLLGNVAYRAGTTIDWDPVDLQITNSPAAQGLIRRAYRPGWEL